MPKHHTDFSPDRRGEWVEVLFSAIAMRKDFEVFKPCSASGATDWIIAEGRRYLRVQVRGTARTTTLSDSHRCSLLRYRDGVRSRFEPGEIDFFAIYVIPKDTWYIIPAEVVIPLASEIAVGGRKYERYREAWHLFRQPPAPAKSPADDNSAHIAAKCPVVSLAELRRARKIPQKRIAANLGVRQTSVSRMEHGTDMYVRRLANFVGAMGGRLELLARFPDLTVQIAKPKNQEPWSCDLQPGAPGSRSAAELTWVSPTGAGRRLRPTAND